MGLSVFSGFRFEPAVWWGCMLALILSHELGVRVRRSPSRRVIAPAVLSADGNAETWAARVREWKRSGLTAADYAERERLNASTLTWWSSQLGRPTLAISRPPVVEVMVAPRLNAASSLEVVLAVPIGFDEATLGRLLTVLEER